MAQRIEAVWVDDLDGTPATESVPFGIDGRNYEIDLTTANAKELRNQIKPFLKKARAIGPPTPGLEFKKIREWATKNGYEVSARGRIHHHVVEAYRSATK